MKKFKILILLFLLINISSCISFEKSEKAPILSEAMELNSNQKILSKIDINENIEFGYSTVLKRFLSKKSQTNTLNVKINVKKSNHSIPENYLLDKSEKIQNVLKEEMSTYKNFDQIDFRLISEGKEVQKIIREI
jgi:azurin